MEARESTRGSASPSTNTPSKAESAKSKRAGRNGASRRRTRTESPGAGAGGAPTAVPGAKRRRRPTAGRANVRGIIDGILREGPDGRATYARGKRAGEASTSTPAAAGPGAGRHVFVRVPRGPGGALPGAEGRCYPPWTRERPGEIRVTRAMAREEDEL